MCVALCFVNIRQKGPFWAASSLILCDWLVPSVTTILHDLLSGCISLLCRCGLALRYRRSNVACLSVGLSVDWSVATVSPAKKQLNRSRYRLGYGLGWAQGTVYYIGVQIRRAKGRFWWGKTLSARQMSGWKSKTNNSSTTEPELCRNARPSGFQ